MKNRQTLLLAGLLLTSISCGKLEEEGLLNITEEQAIGDSVEAGITAMAGMSDDQSGEDLASTYKSKFQKTLDFLNPMTKAYADTCGGRAYQQDCQDGSKSIEYFSCNIASSNQTLAGKVTLDYSDNNCALDTTGQTVRRTFDHTRTTGWGATINVSSEEKSDFEGNTYGGGSILTKVDSGYQLNILGKHKARTSARGRARLDLSIKTNEPLQFDNLNRKDRTITAGKVQIAHNLMKYKVELSPKDLEYTPSCCYPIAGSIDLVYTGSIEGTGSVTFTSCGQATVTKNDENYNVELYSCE